MKQVKKILLVIIAACFFLNINIVKAIEEYNNVSSDQEISSNKEEENESKITDTNITSKSASSSIIYVEVFCGIIGLVMIIIANKTTD